MPALGWLINLDFAASSVTVTPGDWRTLATEVYVPGATAAEVYRPGDVASEVYVPGSVAGEALPN